MGSLGANPLARGGQDPGRRTGDADRDGNRWDARPWWFPVVASPAVGDCCLFVVRDDALAVTFPLEEASQFNNTPALVCSNSAKNDRLWPGVHQHRGELLPGDLILLSSDALACWILQERDRGRRPWQTLSSLNAGEWDGWVQEQRRQRTLKNDDTTLIAIHVE